MSHALCLFVTLALFGAFTSAADVLTNKTTPNVIKAAQKLVKNIRYVSDQAKNGMNIDRVRQNVLDIESDASDLIQLLPGVSECDANLVIKLAAAGTGSHAVLTVLLAEDTTLSVLNGRLSVALAFLDHVAQQLEDKLSLQSTDISGHLAAVIFGTNVTASILDSADEAVKVMTNEGSAYNYEVHEAKRSFNLGGGWSAGFNGVSWQSSNGRHSFNARPKFSGFKPNGLSASYSFSF